VIFAAKLSVIAQRRTMEQATMSASFISAANVKADVATHVSFSVSIVRIYTAKIVISETKSVQRNRKKGSPTRKTQTKIQAMTPNKRTKSQRKSRSRRLCPTPLRQIKSQVALGALHATVFVMVKVSAQISVAQRVKKSKTCAC